MVAQASQAAAAVVVVVLVRLALTEPLMLVALVVTV
jgi:hypothetical protein